MGTGRLLAGWRWRYRRGQAGARGGRVQQRQVDDEMRALARRTLHADFALVALDDVVGNGQSQPGAFTHRLGGEERFEQGRQMLRLNAGAIVDDLDGQARAAALGADLYHARRGLALHGLRRVHDEIEQHLRKLRFRATDPRAGGVQGHVQLYLPAQFMAGQVQRGVDTFVHVHRRKGIRAFVGKTFQVADDLADALDTVAGFLHQRGEILYRVGNV